MKNTILPMINGAAIVLFILVSIAFTTEQGRSIVLNEPITPKSTVVLQESCLSANLNSQAQPYIKQGYIVKCVSVTHSDGCLKGYMVLEKY